jgi:hypothetical protein
MGNLSGVVQQLKKERDRVERQLSGLNAAISAFVGVYGGKAKPTRRSLSAAARRKISLAQKARWAKQKSSVQPAQPKRTMSAAGRKRIAAAQRARWAKVTDQKKAA